MSGKGDRDRTSDKKRYDENYEYWRQRKRARKQRIDRRKGKKK